MSDMATNTYDTIVVGGGHNTLIAAAYMAKVGYSVLVLEKNPYLGGGTVTREVTVPGFLHEMHAIGITWLRVNPVLAHDELGLYAKQGLEMCDTDAAIFSGLFDDGTPISIYSDLDKTCESIAALSPQDAESYRRLTLRSAKLFNFIKRGMFSPPMSMGAMLKFLENSEDGRYLARQMFSSAFDIIDRHFSNSYVRSFLYKWIGEISLSPDEVGTSILFLIMTAMTHIGRLGVFKGGNGQLAEALSRAIQGWGGEVRTHAPVAKFHVDGGRISGVSLANGETFHARKTVIAATPPWDLHRFIDGLDKKPLGDVHDLKPSGWGVFLTHYALNEPPHYKGASDEFNRSFSVSHMVSDLERYRRCYDGFKYGEMPEFFSGQCWVPTLLDPTRAPEGKHTLYFYHYVPLVPEGRKFEDWQLIKEDLADWMLGGLREYADNMTDDNILGRSVESLYDMQLHSPSFRRGDVYGIAITSRQFMGERPTPELAQYRVPGVGGLYLCGPVMHPGGGVIGGGRPVAMRIMMDLKMDLKTAFEAL